MFQSIAENAGTIVVSLALIGLVAWIIVKLRRDARRGKTACGCRCGHCPMTGDCHRHG